LPIPTIGNFDYCGTSITSFNKDVGYNTNDIRDCKSFWKLVSKNRLAEKFRTKNSLDVWKHIHVCSGVTRGLSQGEAKLSWKGPTSQNSEKG